MYNVKSDRQVAYKPTNDKVAIKSRYENPQVIGLGITVYQFGRKKGIVNLLHAKGDCISNDRCILIETGIANEVIRRSIENGFYLPTNTEKSRIVQFHLDNSNFHEDGDNGKIVTNALLLVGAQYTGQRNETNSITLPHTSSMKLSPDNFGDLIECNISLEKNFQHSDLWQEFKCYEHQIEFTDTIKNSMVQWLFAKSLESSVRKTLEYMRDHAIYLEEDDNLMIEIQAEDDVMYPAVMNQTISDNSVDTNPSQMDLKVAMCNSNQSKPHSCAKTSHIEQVILMCKSYNNCKYHHILLTTPFFCPREIDTQVLQTS